MDKSDKRLTLLNEPELLIALEVRPRQRSLGGALALHPLSPKYNLGYQRAWVGSAATVRPSARQKDDPR
jgi:hypothetical protein